MIELLRGGGSAPKMNMLKTSKKFGHGSKRGSNQKKGHDTPVSKTTYKAAIATVACGTHTPPSYTKIKYLTKTKLSKRLVASKVDIIISILTYDNIAPSSFQSPFHIRTNAGN